MSFDEIDDMYDEMLHDEFRSGGKRTRRPRRSRRRGTRGPRGLFALPHRRRGGSRRSGLRRRRRLPGRPRRLLHGQPGRRPLARLLDRTGAAPGGCRQPGLPLLPVVERLGSRSRPPRLAAVAGSLTEGIAPFQALTLDPPTNLPVTTLSLGHLRSPRRRRHDRRAVAARAAPPCGRVPATGSARTATQSALGLSCILDNLTGLLGDLGAAQGIPSSLARRPRSHAGAGLRRDRDAVGPELVAADGRPAGDRPADHRPPVDRAAISVGPRRSRRPPVAGARGARDLGVRCRRQLAQPSS